MAQDPENHVLNKNKHAPNSSLPILIYRDCLPLPLSEEKVTEFLESHAWVKRGTWGHIGQRHFHPNTHECYGKCPSSRNPSWLSYTNKKGGDMTTSASQKFHFYTNSLVATLF